MIIVCKGVREGGRTEACDFVHDGGWDDGELVLHEEEHRSRECRECVWLGFDVPQAGGGASGRDGKRA